MLLIPVPVGGNGFTGPNLADQVQHADLLSDRPETQSGQAKLGAMPHNGPGTLSPCIWADRGGKGQGEPHLVASLQAAFDELSGTSHKSARQAGSHACHNLVQWCQICPCTACPSNLQQHSRAPLKQHHQNIHFRLGAGLLSRRMHQNCLILMFQPDWSKEHTAPHTTYLSYSSDVEY